MEAVLSIVFHLFVAVLDIYSLVWLRMIGGLKWTSVFYLTIWSIVLQSITAIIFSLRYVVRLKTQTFRPVFPIIQALFVSH